MSASHAVPQDKQSWHFIVRSGLAGGIAGCVAKTAVAPLDRVKILFQASNPEFQKYTGSWKGMFRAVGDIYSDGGARGLLQGHSATLLRIFPYAAIKFMAYDQLHHILMPVKEKETPWRRFVAGSGAGAVSVLFTYPLELIRVRLAYQTGASSSATLGTSALRPSIGRAIQTIYHEGEAANISSPQPKSHIAPVASQSLSTSRPKPIFTNFPILKFYRGFSVTLIGIIPYAGSSFLVYGSLRSLVYNSSWWQARQGTQRRRTSAITDLWLGAFSGAISQTVSYPFEVVRRRMQVGGLIRPAQWVGWQETVRDVWRVSGWRGFYVGLGIGYVKVVPMTAVSFMVWEWGKSVLGV